MHFRKLLLFAFCSMFAVGQESPRDLYDKAMASLKGSNQSRNDIQAKDYFERAARAGYTPAQTVTGYFNEQNNTQSAMEWYRKAAEKGDSLAQWILGRIYWDGTGNGRDRVQAEKWLTIAANKGNPYAQYLLGVVKDDLDYQSSPIWFRKAAEQGIPSAQRKLAEKLDNGYGTNINRAEAYFWYLVVGYDGERLQPLETELGAKQVEEVKARAQKKRVQLRNDSPLGGCRGWDDWNASVPTTPPPEYHDSCRF
jgi:TPR repeat protein